ncbi:large tegument protein [Canid alphaherpesvirus 1]|nr:large tegument protein [Canid alphaherpesvirus 1]
MSNKTLDVNVISIGYRNQYDTNIGEGSNISCLRSSLSFLHLIFNNGLETAITADGIDGSLVEGQNWTKETTKKGQKPSMCSIVELPNKISYKDSEESLYCVFSRIYGECGFYTMPGTGFQSTQIPARKFFVDIWSKRSESFTIVIIGFTGLGIYKKEDIVYIFDPHGRDNINQAFVVKLSINDIYTYLAGYASENPESKWSGAMVFFVPSSKNISIRELSSAISLMYGVSESYFVDEQYIERRVYSIHPIISGPSIQNFRNLINSPNINTQTTNNTQTNNYESLTESSWAAAFKDISNSDNSMNELDGSHNVSQNKDLNDTNQPEKRLSLPKKRRPAWTPQTSNENLTINNTHTPTGKPTQKYRSRQMSQETVNVDDISDEQIIENIDYFSILKNRKPLMLNENNTLYEFDNLLSSLETEFNNLETYISQIDDLSVKCIDYTVRVTKHLSCNDNYDILEHFLIIIFERLLTFLIENGTKTRSDISTVLEPIFFQILKAVPIYTPAIDFIQSTHMTLQDIFKYKSMAKLVIDDNSTIGMMAMLKLHLVSESVKKSTDNLNKELDEMESDLKGGINPLGLYNHLSKRLMDFINNQHGKLFYKISDGNNINVFNRIGDLFRRARTREARANQTNISLAKNIIALENAISKSHDTFDAIDIQINNVNINDTELNTVVKSLEPPLISDKILKFIEKSENIVNDAIREYFLKGAQYSARAILMDKSSGLRFQVASASIENLERLLESLPSLDKSLKSLISSLGLQNQNIHPISLSRKTLLLQELIKTGKNLSTDHSLGEWISLLSEAQTGGHIDKRELESLIKDINQINDRAIKVSSMENELSLFKVLSSAVEQAAKDVSDSDPMSIDTLIRGAEDMMKQAKVLDVYLSSGRVSKEVKSQIETRKMEVETLIRSSKQQLQEIQNKRNIIYDQLKNMLLPTTGFVGLRAAPGIIQRMVTDTKSKTAINFRNIVFEAPNTVLTTIHSQLWSLFNQYREALEHPNNTTASSLAGLGHAFAAVIETVLDTNQYYIFFNFFVSHADKLSEDIGLAAIEPESENTINKTVNTIKDVINAVTENGVINNDFKFLLSLKEKYDNILHVLREIQRLKVAQKAIIEAINTTIDVISKLRSINVLTDSTNNIDIILFNAQNVSSDISIISSKGNSELTRIDKNGPIIPAINKDYQELKKLLDVVNQKLNNINELILDINKQRKKIMDNHIEEKWKKDMFSVLEKIETQSIFEVSELIRLRDLAAANSYDTRIFYKQAEKALLSKVKIATNTIEEVFKFNPYAPENVNMEVNPTIALLRNITWWDEFALAAPVLATLFSGVDIESLMRLLRITTNIITFANTNGGKINYYEILTHLSQELIYIPSLVKYIEFYRKGYVEFKDESEKLSSLRADVFQANGSRSSEINRALEEVTYVKSLENATKILEMGVNLNIPGDQMINRAIDYLENFDKTRFKGSAYENIINIIVNRDLSNAKDSFLQSKIAKEEATKRAVIILREVIDVSKFKDRDDATNLLNLKTLLKLTPPPSTINTAIDKATSADELVTQAVLLLQTIEEERELDVKAIEWLQQCRSIIDSHPFTVKIDGKGPMEPYVERIEKLHKLRKDLDDLKIQLTTAEIAWDESWEIFEKESKRVNVSHDTFVFAKDCARTLQASMGVVLGLRTHENYRRLPSKITGTIDTKYISRNKSLDQFYNSFNDTEREIKKFEDLLSKIPSEVNFDALNTILLEFEKYTNSLPKWVIKKYSSYKELINLRLNLYKEYQRLVKNQYFFKPISLITTNLNIEDDLRRICGRVSALMGEKDVVYTLKKAKPNIDVLFQEYSLDSNGTPIEYKLCYKSVGEKMAIMLCGSLGKTLRPVMTMEPIVEMSYLSGIHIMSEILQLRLGFEKARADHFAIFSRFIRHKRQDWTSDQRAQMMAELYSAIIATTLTRQLGVSWHKIKFSIDNNNFTSDYNKNLKNDIKNLPLTLSDIMIILVAHCPMHLVNFFRLDLIRQHEYMSKTVINVLSEALTSKILINTLDVNDKNKIPLPIVNDPTDLSYGTLFSIRVSDWKKGKISQSNLLDIWLNSPDEFSKESINDVIKLIPGNPIKTFTVLARMCIPPDVLSSLWTIFRPDILDQENMSYDDMVTNRLDTIPTIQTTLSTLIDNSNFNIKSESIELYDVSSINNTFTITESPPKAIENVNAMDIVTCAILLGAPIVVAMENQDVFSSDSGLSMCMKLFDFRRGASDFNIGSAISSDLSSWGNILLSYDPNMIENLCLNSQLEQLSNLISNKPLSSSEPFLLILDSNSNINKILWSQDLQIPPTIISFVEDEIISELPFIELDEDFLPPKDPNDPIYTKLISGNNIPDMSIEGSICTELPEYSFPESNLFPYSSSVLQTDKQKTNSIEFNSEKKYKVNDDSPIIGDWEEWLNENLSITESSKNIDEDLDVTSVKNNPPLIKEKTYNINMQLDDVKLIKQPTTVQQPAKQPTTVQQPAKQPTTVQQPAKQPTTVQQPAKQPTTVQQPAKQPTTVQQPAKQPTTVQQPAKQPTTVQQPAKQPTTVQQPANIQKYMYIKPSLGPFKNDIQNLNFNENDYNYMIRSILNESSLNKDKNKTESQTLTNITNLNTTSGDSSLNTTETSKNNNFGLSNVLHKHENNTYNQTNNYSSDTSNGNPNKGNLSNRKPEDIKLPDSPDASDGESETINIPDNRKPEDIKLPDSPDASDGEPDTINLPKNLSVPESKNLSVPESKNLSVPESKNLSVPESKNLSVPESKNLSDGEPEDASDGEPEDASDGEPEDASDGEPEDASDGEPEDASDGEPEDASDGEPEDASDGEPEDASDGEPEDASDGEPEDASDGEPEDASDGEPEDASDGEPEDARPSKFESTPEHTNDKWGSYSTSGNQYKADYHKQLAPFIPPSVLHTKIRQTPSIKNHRFRKSYDKFSKFSKSSISNTRILSSKDKPKTTAYEHTKTIENNKKSDSKSEQVKDISIQTVQTEAESQELERLYDLYSNSFKKSYNLDSQYKSEESKNSETYSDKSINDVIDKNFLEIIEDKYNSINDNHENPENYEIKDSSYIVSWNQHLVPTSPFNSEFTLSEINTSDIDEDNEKDEDNESLISTPTKRVINSDDLLGRRYFRNTSLSALSLLISACQLIKKRLKNTRQFIVERQQNLILELHKISVILG